MFTVRYAGVEKIATVQVSGGVQVTGQILYY